MNPYIKLSGFFFFFLGKEIELLSFIAFCLENVVDEDLDAPPLKEIQEVDAASIISSQVICLKSKA